LKIQATFFETYRQNLLCLAPFFSRCTAIALYGLQREFGMVLGGGAGGGMGGGMFDWQLWCEQTEEESEDFHVTQEPFPS
jgi:hypothetical protein